MLKVILDGIVHDANIFPVYDDMSDKAEVSERFRSYGVSKKKESLGVVCVVDVKGISRKCNS